MELDIVALEREVQMGRWVLSGRAWLRCRRLNKEYMVTSKGIMPIDTFLEGCEKYGGIGEYLDTLPGLYTPWSEHKIQEYAFKHPAYLGYICYRWDDKRECFRAAIIHRKRINIKRVSEWKLSAKAYRYPSCKYSPQIHDVLRTWYDCNQFLRDMIYYERAAIRVPNYPLRISRRKIPCLSYV